MSRCGRKLFMAWMILGLMAGSCAKPVQVGVIRVKAIMDESTWGLTQVNLLRREIVSRESALKEKCGGPLEATLIRVRETENLDDDDPVRQEALRNHAGIYEKCMNLRGQLQEELGRIQEKFATAVMEKVQSAAEIIARRRKLDLVLFQDQKGTVLWSGPRVDVTAEVKNMIDSEP